MSENVREFDLHFEYGNCQVEATKDVFIKHIEKIPVIEKAPVMEQIRRLVEALDLYRKSSVDGPRHAARVIAAHRSWMEKMK